MFKNAPQYFTKTSLLLTAGLGLAAWWIVDDWLRHRKIRKPLVQHLQELSDPNEDVREDAVEYILDYLRNIAEEPRTYDDEYFMESDRGDRTTERAEIVFDYGGVTKLLNLLSEKESNSILKTACICLTIILKNVPSSRTFFAKNNGIQKLVELCTLVSDDVKADATQTLKAATTFDEEKVELEGDIPEGLFFF